MDIYILDFGIILDKNGRVSLIKYHEARRLFSLISKINTLYCLNTKIIEVDKKSNKKIRYWKNKLSKNCAIKTIDESYTILSLLNKLSSKYNEYLYKEI